MYQQQVDGIEPTTPFWPASKKLSLPPPVGEKYIGIRILVSAEDVRPVTQFIGRPPSLHSAPEFPTIKTSPPPCLFFSPPRCSPLRPRRFKNWGLLLKVTNNAREKLIPLGRNESVSSKGWGFFGNLGRG